jgi:D-alanyl-D-alanine carboxypeptidase
VVRFAVLALIVGLATPAYAAEIVVDLNDGRILVENDADAPRLPASLAKLMTAYVAFEAMQGGEIAPDAMIRISPAAAAQPPVKLGLRTGRELSFEALLGAALVGSKNDAAVAVAEAVAGDEAAFVERMNNAAQDLGMINTRFANATGLPRPGQRSTARDIALLSRALLERFPARSALFARRSVRAMGKRVSTTNPLFGRVPGASGLKTGFTCAAGYGIAGLVEQGDRRLLIVTLGHRDKRARLRQAKALIDQGVAAQSRSRLAPAIRRSTEDPPDIGACADAPAAVAVVTSDVSPEERALYAREVARLRSSASPPRPPAPRAPAVVRPLSGWGAFFGGFAGKALAEARLTQAVGRLGGTGTPYTEIRRRDGRVLALVHGLDRRAASALCRSMREYCIILAPQVLLNPRARWRR